jgi:hypothetical protein
MQEGQKSGLYLDVDVSRGRFGFWDLLDDQTIEAPKLFDDNCTHQTTPWIKLFARRLG